VRTDEELSLEVKVLVGTHDDLREVTPGGTESLGNGSPDAARGTGDDGASPR
jgi:hypothetical protein